MVSWLRTLASLSLVALSLNAGVCALPSASKVPAASLYDDSDVQPGSARPLLMQPTQAPAMTSQADMNAYRARVPFAADAYCTDLQVGSRVGSDGTVLFKTGNGDDIQMAYVAYSPTQGIVVGHQGTNLSSADSIVNDINFQLTDPVPELQWLGPDVQVATGFQDAWNDTAVTILEQVLAAQKQHPDARILVTGHSLGAAIAMLTALHLKHNTGAAVDAVLFGLPRTGNPEFATAVDANLPVQRHISHYRDPVPHLPGRSLGFQHPSGEVWIGDEDGAVVYDCAGQEDSRCSNSVPFLLYQTSDHSGPYFGLTMKCRNGDSISAGT